MYRLVQYLKFFFAATNQHGVHSPFIYSYVTKCLYAQRSFRYAKSVNVLLKSIDYFGIDNIGLPANHDIIMIVRKNFPDVYITTKIGQALWIGADNSEMIANVLSEENSVQNDSVLFIDGIYDSKENYSAWKKVKMNGKVTVTVDLFFCGVVFFRKEQAEEHFKIRI